MHATTGPVYLCTVYHIHVCLGVYGIKYILWGGGGGRRLIGGFSANYQTTRSLPNFSAIWYIAVLISDLSYLLEWTLRLQLFLGLERWGVYSRVATVRVRLPFKDALVHVICNIILV